MLPKFYLKKKLEELANPNKLVELSEDDED